MLLLFAGFAAAEEPTPDAFEQYCGSCHALPDVVAIEPPQQMYDWVQMFGASSAEIKAIKAWVEYLREENK
jgi:hypothetical protein